MSASPALIAGWARSAVVPRGGAFGQLEPHEIGAPVLQALLARAGVAPGEVDAVVVGNALGAGGNPARMVALAAGLSDRCACFTVDTQCCSGLDAVTMAVGLLGSGQASLVVAGGVEAWSRSPIRQHRPRHPGEPAVPYERPAFAPDPERDPDMLVSAARYALQAGWTRQQQDAYTLRSHALASVQGTTWADELVPVAGVTHDLGPRKLLAERVARMPAAVRARDLGRDWSE
ncbi:MAG: beta-ketoacyl synthase N-terminal-like domain-containing protein, partial [Hydrogenophaga sp.]|nr:beta-ketoacyl synthase N-terminal-like domain-containing protein [Hydrogenophaga sp.]